VRPNEVSEVLSRPISQELLARDLTRLAYVAKDGTPRTVPIAFTWNGTEIVMCTAKNAPKLLALRRNPVVALTIDTEAHPLGALLLAGAVWPLDAYLKEVVDYGDALRPMPTVARWVEVSGTISKHFARLWAEDVSVKQVVSDLSTEVKPLLEPRL